MARRTQQRYEVCTYFDCIVCAVLVDAGIATNYDFSFQLVFIMVLMDKHGYVNGVHSRFLKSKQITKSVLAAALFDMVHFFDVSSTIRLSVNEMLGRFSHHSYSRTQKACIPV